MPRIPASLLLMAALFPVGLSAQDTAKPEPKLKRHPDRISIQEIEAAPDAAVTAMDLVEHLRPNWLRGRGATSVTLQTSPIQVYVAGLRKGGLSSLSDVARSAVKEIQHLRGTDAVQRFGMGHDSGAILVLLK